MTRRLAGRMLRAPIGLALVVGLVPSATTAAAPEGFISASFESGWAALTRVLPDDPGGRPYDPSDPPYKYADGTVEYLLTRWNRAVCDGTRPGDVPPIVTVVERDDPAVDGDGLPMKGVITVEAYNSSRGISQPGRLVRFDLFDRSGTTHLPVDPAYPHGFAAARHTDDTQVIPGGGGPYTTSWRVHFRTATGLCDVTKFSTFEQSFAIDRDLPIQPSITAPKRWITLFPKGSGGCTSTNICYRKQDPIILARPQQGTVLVEGTAFDPGTDPEADDQQRLETSGVAVVIVRVYNERRLIRSYSVENPDCAIPHPLNPDITMCSERLGFSVDITSELRQGGRFGVDAYAIDRSGYRVPVGMRTAAMPENLRGPESYAIAFYYLGEG